MSQDKQFLTKPNLARRWQKTSRTIDRWLENPAEGFPVPVIIGGRKHWDLDDIEAFERACAATSHAGTREAA